MSDNPMINAVNTSKVKNIYECIEDPKIFEPSFSGKYNYDNVIEEQIDLKEVITLNLFKTINSMNNKLINGRIKDKESEKIRIDYLKTYVNACNCFINLVNKGQVNVKYDKKVLTDFINLEDTLFKDD